MRKGIFLMSRWTDFRDDIIESLKFDEVTEEVKERFSNWLVETVLPLAQTAADNFVVQTREQAKSENGWCKARDWIVLPVIINVGLWVIEKSLTKVNSHG